MGAHIYKYVCVRKKVRERERERERKRDKEKNSTTGPDCLTEIRFKQPRVPFQSQRQGVSNPPISSLFKLFGSIGIA